MSGLGSGGDRTEAGYDRCAGHMPISQGDEQMGLSDYILITLSFIGAVIFFPIAMFGVFRIIRTYERGIVLRLGKLRKRNGKTILGAGVQFVLPCIDEILTVDLRTRSVNIPPQEILTRDAVTVNVDAVVYLRVTDPASALLKVENAARSSELLAVSTLRNVLGTYELAQLLTDREEIDKKMQRWMDSATDPWGIFVERVEIKDVALPQDMQRAMATEAHATRASRAKVIEAQGELDASEMLRMAATQIAQCPSALQLRYLQTLSTIAAEQNSTIVFPLPIEMFSGLFTKNTN